MTTLPKKILIVRLGALGDVANALVLAAAIKRAAPDTFVGWAVHNLALPIVEGNPVVDRAYLWDKKLGVRGLIFWVLGFDRARTKEFAWLFLNESIAPLPKSAFKPWHIGEQYLESATHLRIEASAELACSKRTCRMPRHDCMLDIGGELALDAVQRQLERVDAQSS